MGTCEFGSLCLLLWVKKASWLGERGRGFDKITKCIGLWSLLFEGCWRGSEASGKQPGRWEALMAVTRKMVIVSRGNTIWMTSTRVAHRTLEGSIRSSRRELALDASNDTAFMHNLRRADCCLFPRSLCVNWPFANLIRGLLMVGSLVLCACA